MQSHSTPIKPSLSIYCSLVSSWPPDAETHAKRFFCHQTTPRIAKYATVLLLSDELASSVFPFRNGTTIQQRSAVCVWLSVRQPYDFIHESTQTERAPLDIHRSDGARKKREHARRQFFCNIYTHVTQMENQ
jgi:hypothetical protein